MMRQRADHLERAPENLGIGLRHAEAVREDEAVVFSEKTRELSRDQLRVHLVRIRQEGDAVLLAHALEHFLDARHRTVEEVAPDVVKVADAAAVSGAVAEELVKLPERDGAALHVAISAGILEQINQLIARDRRLGADGLQHSLVCELQNRVAEVEEKPLLFRHGFSVYPERSEGSLEQTRV